MIKYFTTRFNHINLMSDDISPLKNEFPNFYFKNGMRKNEKGIYAIFDLDNLTYDAPLELDNGDFFYPPTKENKEKLIKNLSNYKTDKEERINIKLISGSIIEIVPASAIPKQIYFGSRIKNKENDNNPFSKATEYSKMAYKLYEISSQNKINEINDEEFLKFIELALIESYKIPTDLFNCLELVSYQDLQNIFYGAMGIVLTEEDKKKLTLTK